MLRPFYHVAQVLVTYGSRVVTAGPTSDPYGQKYKGIWICLELLKRGLAGNYVNFGVFELYGDPALKVAPHPCSPSRHPAFVHAPDSRHDHICMCPTKQK